MHSLLENLEDSEIIPTFAARMRVAYRRDDIKLRNRSIYTSRWSSTCGFSFLVRERAWIEHFYGGHDLLPSLHTGILC